MWPIGRLIMLMIMLMKGRTATDASNGVVLATRNGGVTSRNWHFEKFLRLGRLHYEDNISSPEFVPTSDQCADIWTKALDKTTFLKHRAKLVR